ncbi:MAG: SUMF1/EgtB/PvdO family nonheme iron enzyme [Chloroflexi bacterium]|nr:SUMF1/EgtB/PvdO family nonheme iron enzyme [Chloroflexota bacterium]
MADEHSIAERVIAQVNADLQQRRGVQLELVSWARDGAGSAQLSPAEAEDAGLPHPSVCDVVIVILWGQMGATLPPEYAKPNGGTFSDLEWIYRDASRQARQTGTPMIMAYRRTVDEPLAMDDPDFFTKREQRAQVESFFGTFHNEAGALRDNYNTYTSRRAFLEHVEHHLTLLIELLLDAPPLPQEVFEELEEPTPPPPPRWLGMPYPGLRPFMPEEAPIFCGRARETEALIERLSDPAGRFLAINGTSGSGKSSLVNAGLLPHLHADAIPGSRDWLYVRVVPGEIEGDPFLTLASRLRPFLEQPGWQHASDLAERLAGEFLDNPDALRETCHQVLAGRRDGAEMLLFFDQFEEVFTVVRPEFREPFIHLVAYAATVEHLRVLITLRADYYAQCLEWPGLAVLLQNGSFPLGVPDRAALYQMITQPAQRAGFEFESVLDHRLLADTSNEPGGLPRLAFALRELVRAAEERGESVLRHADYDEMGGVHGAVGRRARMVLDDLDQAARDELAHLFRTLVVVDEFGAATRHIPQIRLADIPARARLVRTLVDARLLTQGSGRDHQPALEIAHDILFESWPALVHWIEGTQDDLRLLRRLGLAAREWDDNDRARAFLWPDERLLPVYDMLDRLEPDLDPVTRDFIKLEGDQLVDELRDPNLSHTRRLAIGERLAELGDHRPGVGLQPDGLPDIVWCHVPGGRVVLDSEERSIAVEPFYIARYPITFIQFQSFIDAEDGFDSDVWWAGLGTRPVEPGPQSWPINNHPREHVSWYEAVAFCRWLSARRGYMIRLPTEWEWQQAASGGVPVNVYPWGKTWDAQRANTSESKLGRTTAVGVYPAGASPVGALDMSGGVWEWCLNEHADPSYTGLSGNPRHATRGGAWGFDKLAAQTTSRDWPDAAYRFNLLGFRVACAFPVSGPGGF